MNRGDCENESLKGPALADPAEVDQAMSLKRGEKNSCYAF